MLFARTVGVCDEESLGVMIPSEKVIGCLRRVIIRLPDLLGVSIVLARYLFRRFMITVSDDDYNEGMAILDKIVGIRGPGDTPSPYQPFRLTICHVWEAGAFRAGDLLLSPLA